ncbi:hypothetical protein [Pseudomonas fragi]|uniref:hypothetical protein n=1 Tax=Pseudomonas fragi TaxID=296 RepID=UPI0014764D3F|nr:hypothetical protein [Pseudomonas fragi]NNB17983.1 hypothetical protein [Pseudomonas fragi]NNB22805.1 hypothetical protein [Pseudomonas fragi]
MFALAPPHPRLENVPGLERPINTWLAENVYKPFSNPLFCPVRAAGSGFFKEPRMRLTKWARPMWEVVVVCLRVHHVYELLRDRFDDLS